MSNTDKNSRQRGISIGYSPKVEDKTTYSEFKEIPKDIDTKALEASFDQPQYKPVEEKEELRPTRAFEIEAKLRMRDSDYKEIKLKSGRILKMRQFTKREMMQALLSAARIIGNNALDVIDKESIIRDKTKEYYLNIVESRFGKSVKVPKEKLSEIYVEVQKQLDKNGYYHTLEDSILYSQIEIEQYLILSYDCIRNFHPELQEIENLYGRETAINIIRDDNEYDEIIKHCKVINGIGLGEVQDLKSFLE